MRRLALAPTLIAALLLPSGAYALGLGEIEIQSALNQRLDAEIPLRGVRSGQADGIEVYLAPEAAFNNVGLDRPFALTRLQFAVKQRDAGGHYVHITSPESIVEPFLSFLVKVDWSGGNLLREYTVLLDPPVFTSEEGSQRSGGGTTDTARTSGTGDGAGTTGEIERGAESSRAQSEAGDSGTRSGSGSGQTGSGGGDKPVFLEVEEREDRARADADRDAGRSTDASSRYGPVGEGETLWSIASRLKSGDMTVQQMMVALLRYNPDAFRGRNINRLKAGYVLRVPDGDGVLEVSAQRALAWVREQNGVWRELQESARSQPSMAESDEGADNAGGAAQGATGSDDAELSIVGADEGGASSDEAVSATGSGSADDSEKLQLARAQLESTRLEKEELASRVDELAQTIAKMERLLEVRDKRLSALQEQLRKLENRQAGDGDSGNGDSGMAADDETATDIAAADDEAAIADDDESVAASGDDNEVAAATDGDTGEDGAAGTTGSDAGSDDAETTTAGDGETATDDTTSADAAGDDATASAETTASTADETDASYIPEDKRATDADQGVRTTRTQEPEETWLDQVNGVFAAVGSVFAGVGGALLGGPVGLGLVAAVVLLGVGLVLMRRRRQAAESGDAEPFESDDTRTGIAPFDADSSGRFEAADSGVGDDDADMPLAGAGDATDDGDVHSAGMDEEFGVASLDDAEPENRASTAIDDEEAEKDDTVAEADVYLAYGLHQQAEDLLRLALREHPGNAMYHEKLLETLYASGNNEEFIEEAQTFRGLVDGPESRLWQRVLAMGRDLAPRHELFAEGDTDYTAADVQPARPEGTDIELDDAEGEIDFGFDDEPDSMAVGGTGSGDERDDEFSSTMALDSAAVEGDGGLVGPDDDRSPSGDAGTEAAAGAGDIDEDDDLEFDLGDLDGLSDDQGRSSAVAPGSDTGTSDADEIEFDLDDDPAAASGDNAAPGGEADDGTLDFDLDFDEAPAPKEAPAGIDDSDSNGADTPASADTDDGGLDFDFEEAAAPNEGSAAIDDSDAGEPDSSASTDTDDGALDFDFDFDLEQTGAETSAASAASTDPQGATAPEPGGSADDDPLELGDLELGDLDSMETDSAGATDSGEAEPAHAQETPAAGDPSESDAGAFDLSDLENGHDEGPGEASGEASEEASEEASKEASEEAPADEGIDAGVGGDYGGAEDDGFDLSDLDAMGGSGAGADDDDAFDLDDPGSTEPRTPDATGSAPAEESRAEESADAGTAADPESSPDGDDEFDTMLDLARAYMDMGDPESAANALEEVVSSGNEQQRSEAQSLLESVR